MAPFLPTPYHLNSDTEKPSQYGQYWGHPAPTHPGEPVFLPMLKKTECIFNQRVLNCIFFV